MTALLLLAAFLAFAVGLAHSVLGERYVIGRLLRHEERLPPLLGGTDFTARTLRFAWHVTSIAWWGFATLLFLLSQGEISSRSVAVVLAATFLHTGAIILGMSRGRHLAWVVFLAIGAICLCASIVG